MVLWRIVAASALILPGLFAAFGWPWVAAACGLIAGTYVGALGVVCLFNLVNGPLKQQTGDRMAESGCADRRPFDRSQGGALSILNSSLHDLRELGRRLRPMRRYGVAPKRAARRPQEEDHQSASSCLQHALFESANHRDLDDVDEGYDGVSGRCCKGIDQKILPPRVSTRRREL